MALSRVQALQLLGLKAGAQPEQITDRYHKLHPGAARAEADGHPERMRRLDEAYRLLLSEADPELKHHESAEKKRAEQADHGRSDYEERKETSRRREAERSSGSLVIVFVLLLLGGGGIFLWYLGMIPGLPPFPGK